MCIVLVLNSVRFTRNSDKRFCLFELYRDKWPLPFAIFREFFFILIFHLIFLLVFVFFVLFFPCFRIFLFVFFYNFVFSFYSLVFVCLFVCFFNFLFLPFPRSYLKALKHYLHFNSMQILPLIRLLSMTH